MAAKTKTRTTPKAAKVPGRPSKAAGSAPAMPPVPPAPVTEEKAAHATPEISRGSFDDDAELEPVAALTAKAPTRFRVSLPGCRVRVEDPEKGHLTQDYLDVEASNAGEAWMKFQAYNGIRSTTQTPEISPID